MPKLLRTLILALVPVLAVPAFAEGGLLNVSYDVSRDFYKDYNPLFPEALEGDNGRNG
jgi:sulfate transport system substrate-binding protein